MHLPSSITASSNRPSATRYASSSLWNKRTTEPPYSKHNEYVREIRKKKMNAP